MPGKPRGRRFPPGNGFAFKRGENGAERAKARVEIAVDILRQGRDEPEVRAIVERVSAAIADPIDRARKVAQELAPLCVETTAGADRARDAIDLVAATVEAPAGIVEHAIFGEDLVEGRAPTRGVVFTEDIMKVASQQGRYAVGHGLSPLGIECGSRDPQLLDYG
jgi:hypothetical protein